MEQIQHQCLKQCCLALLPERIGGLGTFGCGVLYQIGNETEYVFVIVDVLEWIVAKRCVGIDEVKDTHLISFLFQQTACLSEQLGFGVCNDHRAAALHDVRQGKASGFSCTGASHHEDVETSAVLVGVQADAEVLRQQDVLGVRLLAVFLTDLPGITPSGGTMFFPSAVVLLAGIKNADPGCVK
ncbi:Uncharacterised protein [Agathobacter rectalis]|uniref:Uncharacterized protein n=1 Tax=Agathobacter rectalis TaxID=39491 RepID=A0A173VF19_9FIRM|nr:Uncharacterised protein [Agathobacter rectalis]